MTRRRLLSALRAGLVTYAVAILLAALFAAPLIADRNVGHLHPDGVAAHVHAITQLLSADRPPTTPSALPSWTLALALVAIAHAVHSLRRTVRIRSRAPPVSI